MSLHLVALRNKSTCDGINTTPFFKRLWNLKEHKIKRDTMISVYSAGGLRIIDLRQIPLKVRAISATIIC